MDGFLLFLHLGGLALWLGSIVTVSILLFMMKKDIQSPQIAGLVRKTIKIFNRITHPSAFIVLLSGIWMLMRIGMDQHDSFPFWLLFMEQAGSIIILVFITALSIMGKKVTKKLQASDIAAAQKSIQSFVITTLVLAVAVLAVVYVVSAKF